MISNLLGTSSLQPVILVGVGNLGRALLSYRGFEKEGFEIVGAFDADPARVKARGDLGNRTILPMDGLPLFVRERQVKMAIMTVPGTAAQTVANELVSCGIVGILNFSPVVLQIPDEVMANNVNLAIELENLSYFLRA